MCAANFENNERVHWSQYSAVENDLLYILLYVYVVVWFCTSITPGTECCLFKLSPCFTPSQSVDRKLPRLQPNVETRSSKGSVWVRYILLQAHLGVNIPPSAEQI